MVDEDAQFFAAHADRQARIRLPLKQIYIDGKTHRTAVGDEMEQEFQSLGDHKRERRRVLVYRVPPDNPMYDSRKPQLLKIPMLLFADETIEDRDDILLPEIHRIMAEQARYYVQQELKKGYTGL